MIDITLDIIEQEVNTFIKSKIKSETDTGDKIVKLSGIVNSKKDVVIPSSSIGLSLLNIEEEFYLKENTVKRTITDGNITVKNPPINLNLQIIFIVNFPDYKTSLQYLSAIIASFQAKSVFTPENTPSLGLQIPKLIFELNTVGLEQQHYIWSMIGVSYMPSVIYKVRMVSIQQDEIIIGGGMIKDINCSLKSIKE